MATHPSSSSLHPVLKVARNADAPTFGKDTIEEMERKPQPNEDLETAEWIKMLQRVLPPETCEVHEQCIYKVPPIIREAHPKAYTPKTISIGPFHNPRGRDTNRDTNFLWSMEDLKLKYLKGFLNRIELLNRTELPVEDFLSRLKEMEDNIRNCYAGGPVIYNSNDFLRIIITDACFIIELFLRSGENWTQNKNDPILSKTWLLNHIKLDMILLENQLPFFVLQDIYEYADRNSKFPSFIEITTCFFDGFNKHKIDTKGLSPPKHFVDLLRIFMKPSSFDLEQNEQETNPIPCGSQPTGDFQISVCLPKNKEVQAVKKIKNKDKGPMVCSAQPTGDFQLSFPLLKKKEEQEIIPIQTPIQTPILENKEEQENNGIVHVYSASQLSEAGLKFEVSKDQCRLPDLKFDEGVLKMPCFSVDDNTEVVFGNILAYEECHFPVSGYINQYMKILDFLINTEKDVSILIDNGIIVNLMGDASSVVTVINNLNKNVSMPDFNSDYHSLCLSLNGFYENPLNKYKAMFIHEYFNTPLKIASTSSAVLLLLLTLFQTICSV